ncbi:MAG: hypothetical protein AABZ15_17260 [Nitrospirota bacterium]
MAKIKYTGPVNPLRIEGVGIVGPEFVPCSEAIAREFEKEKDFEVQFDSPPETSASSAVKKGRDKS